MQRDGRTNLIHDGQDYAETVYGTPCHLCKPYSTPSSSRETSLTLAALQPTSRASLSSRREGACASAQRLSRSSAVVGLAKTRDNRTRPVAILVALVRAPPRKVQIAIRFGVHRTQLAAIEGVSSSAR